MTSKMNKQLATRTLEQNPGRHTEEPDLQLFCSLYDRQGQHVKIRQMLTSMPETYTLTWNSFRHLRDMYVALADWESVHNLLNTALGVGDSKTAEQSTSIFTQIRPL